MSRIRDSRLPRRARVSQYRDSRPLSVKVVWLPDYGLNNLDTVSKGSTVFRNPWAPSSALATLGTLQPSALGFLNTVDPLDTVSNCYMYVG